MNKLFVVNKPIFISSNKYLNRYKKKLKTKKIGFSGTLDPFAKGSLILATNQYTKLFRFFKKTPKVYIATLWFGARSYSLDIENIYDISYIEKLPINKIHKAFDIIGNIRYYPPKYSAKKINGQRAYNLVRENKEFNLKEIESIIYDIDIISYNHPFLTFKISVSEGSYIRSIAQIILNRLGSFGTLSYLERVSEGDFFYQNEKYLNPLKYFNIEKNLYIGNIDYLKDGKKLSIDYFKKKYNGIFFIEFKDFFSIIEIQNKNIRYILNNIRL